MGRLTRCILWLSLVAIWIAVIADAHRSHFRSCPRYSVQVAITCSRYGVTIGTSYDDWAAAAAVPGVASAAYTDLYAELYFDCNIPEIGPWDYVDKPARQYKSFYHELRTVNGSMSANVFLSHYKPPFADTQYCMYICNYWPYDDPDVDWSCHCDDAPPRS